MDKTLKNHYGYLSLNINRDLQITSQEGDLNLWKEMPEEVQYPLPLNFLKDKIRFLIISLISRIELEGKSELTASDEYLKENGINEVDFLRVNVKSGKDNIEYSVILKKESSEEGGDQNSTQISSLQKKTEKETDSHFKTFFSRLERVKKEVEKREKVTEELISLNKQLTLKEQLLEKSRNSIEALLNNNLQAVILIDTFYAVQAFNLKAKDLIYSISEKDLEKNAFFLDYFKDNNLSSLKNDFNKISKNKESQFTVKRKYFDKVSGKACHYLVNYTAVHDDEQNLNAVSVGFMNITHLNEVQSKLTLSQKLIGSVFNATSLGILISNSQGEIINHNKSLLEHLNIKKELVKNKTINDLFSGKLKSNEFPFFDTRNEQFIEWSSSYADKKQFLIRAELINNTGDDKLIVATLKDITEQIKLENLITRSSKLAKIGSWEIDIAKNSIWLSPMTREIHELSDSFQLNLESALKDFYDESDHSAIIKEFEETISGNKTLDLEVLLNTAKGKRKWVRLNAEYELNNGEVTKIVGSIQDIDDRKKTELELLEKTKFLTLLSELNQEILNYKDWEKAILGILQTLGEAMDLDRVYFFRIANRNNEQIFEHQIEWQSKENLSQLNYPHLKDFKNSFISNAMKALQSGKPYKKVISELPEGKEKEFFKECNIRSVYNIPVRLKNEFHGVLGFEDCKRERQWTEHETSFLSTFTQNFSLAYEGYLSQIDLRKGKLEREAILNSIKGGFLSTDNNWIINYWNEEAEKLTSFSKKKALGSSLWKIFPETTNLSLKKEFELALKNKETKIIESLFPLLERWFELNIYPSDEGVSVYFKDVTERKLKEQELFLSNQRFEKVAEATSDAIWDWDIVNDSFYRGPGFEKIFGVNIKKSFKKADFWTDKFHREDLQRLKSSVDTAVEDPKKTYWQEEYRVIRDDGSKRTVLDKGIIIRDNKGKALRMIGAITDVTDRRDYEESLEYLNNILQNRAEELTELNVELERFAYIASHDLQEPLRMITGFLTQLSKRYSDNLDERANQYIDFAVDGAKRMRTIILDLLEYSKVGKVEFEKYSKVDINQVVREVKDVLGELITETNASIEVDNLPVVHGIKLSFVQVFQNLISNALKYRKPDTSPEIKISAEETEDKFIFSVSDKGIGIDPKFHEKIFVIFQRLHNKDNYSGTGVGLAIVKKTIEQMDGEIWLEKNEYEGTTFFFSIPKKQ